MYRLSFPKFFAILSLGNIIEYYDFALYGFMATTISGLFFPQHDPTAGLILSFGIFAIGFIARPIGAFVLGYVGDRWGGVVALRLALIAMAGSTLGVGLLPTHDSIGSWAAVFLTGFRMIQGMSMGAEFPTSLLVSADYGKGRYSTVRMGAVLTGATVLGWFVGATVVFVAKCLPLEGWWRVPFLLGALLTFSAYYLRQQLLGNAPSSPRRNVFVSLLQKNAYYIFAFFCIAAFIGALFYTLFLFPSVYLVRYVGLSEYDVSQYVLYTLFLDLICLSLMWKLVERVGELKMLRWSIGLGVFVSYPLFQALAMGNNTLIWAVRITTVTLMCGVVIPYTSLLMKTFNNQSKYMAASISYTLGTAIMGGISPMLLVYWIDISQNIYIPGLYLAGCGCIAWIGLRMIKARQTKEESS